MAESALLKSARKLNRGALPVIFDIYAPAVYSYCFRLCLDPIRSDELVGIVFSRLLETLTHAEIPAIKLRVYLFQTAYQVMIERSEAAGQAIQRETESRETQRSPIAREHLGEMELQTAHAIPDVNTRLNAVERHVLLLRFVEDFDLQETALIVGTSVNNVKVIQSQALTKING